MRAGEIARELPARAGARTAVGDALEGLKQSGGEHLLVGRDRRAFRFVTKAELARAVRLGLRSLRLGDMALQEAPVVSADADLSRLREAMSACRSGLLLLRRGRTVIGCVGEGDLPGRPPPGGSAPSRSIEKELVRSLPPGAGKALERLGRLARGEAYLVGGAVRDAILGRTTRDLDVVVTGGVAGLARRMGGRVVSHGAFGTATVTLEDGTRIDLARSRGESYAQPAALPRVRTATLVEDLGRRDFTVNAMAVQLAPSGFGRLHDPHGGLADLEDRKLRVLHGLSFIEDPTRAFRAVGLSARLEFTIEPRTARLIRVAIREGVFERLSAVRLRHELERLLGGARRSAAVRRMVALGLLRTLDRELRGRSGLYRRLDRVEAVVARYRSLRGEPEIAAWRVALGVLVQGLDGARVQALLDRIQPGRIGRRIVGEMVERPRRVIENLDRPKLRPSEIFEACRGLHEEALLLAVVLARSARVRSAVERFFEELADATPDIDGRDLMAAGMQPDRSIAVALEAALRDKLDGRAPTAREQLRSALRAVGRA